MTNIYFDLDDTLVRFKENERITSGHKVLLAAIEIGFNPILLSYCFRERGINKVRRWYPDVFKTMLFRDEWLPMMPINDTDGILVDDLPWDNYITIAKVGYLGIKKDRFFWFNPFQIRPEEAFKKQFI